jgi:hypothetical protein
MSKFEKAVTGATASAKSAVDDGAKDVAGAVKEAVHSGEHAVSAVAHKAKIVIKESTQFVKDVTDAVVDDAIHAAHDARDNVNAALGGAKSTKKESR